MALRLQIISRHRQNLGDFATMEFGHMGGTIGRSLESDWVLPDGQRYLSSRHASIDYHSGSFYLIDTSTNGVYINESEEPVGRGNPQRLFNGDRLRLGDFEISVEIEGEDSADAALADERHVDPVTKAQRVTTPDTTYTDLIAADEISAIGIEMLLREEAEEENTMIALHNAAKLAAASLHLQDDPPPPMYRHHEPAEAPRGEPPPVSAAATVAAHAQTHSTASAKTAAASAPPAGALDAFFRGAGLPGQKLDPKQAEQMLLRLGQMMREIIVGVTENLRVRTEQKNLLRTPTTPIQPRNSNPLMFSASVEDALSNLLFRQTTEYSNAVEAVREAFLDMKQHQQSLLSALPTAIVDYIGRLDPGEIEAKFANGKRGALMSAANKLRYWDLYKDLYQVVTQHKPGQFPQQFLEEMARAYAHERAPTGGSPSSSNTQRAKAG